MCWFLAVVLFLYIFYEVFVGLATAMASEADPVFASNIGTSLVMTTIRCGICAIVFLLPMLGFSATKAVVFMQIG